MCKPVFLIIGLLLLNVVYAQDTIAILARANVQKASELEVQRDKQRTIEIVRDSTTAVKHFNHFVMVGPGLWTAIKQVDYFKTIPESFLILTIPKFDANGERSGKEEVVGKILQKKEDFQALFTWLNNHYDLKTAAIVERNNTDNFLCWLYFAKIEEPVISVQSSKGRFIFKFAEQGLYFMELTDTLESNLTKTE